MPLSHYLYKIIVLFRGLEPDPGPSYPIDYRWVRAELDVVFK